MKHFVFLDESGDLGWSLGPRYGKRKSSDFFTIAFLIVPETKTKHISRFLRKFHRDRGGKFREVKATKISKRKSEALSRAIKSLLERHQDIRIGSVTLEKKYSPDTIRRKGNQHILYNFMVCEYLTNTIKNLIEVEVIPDKQSIPTGSLNSGFDLLKTELWLKSNSSVELVYNPKESHLEVGLMFVDWIANFVWRHYEYAQSGAYSILKPDLSEVDMLF